MGDERAKGMGKWKSTENRKDTKRSLSWEAFPMLSRVPLTGTSPHLTSVTEYLLAGVGSSFPIPGVVYGRCLVSIEPGEEATVLSNVPRVKEEGVKTTGGNRVRREFFERHR